MASFRFEVTLLPPSSISHCISHCISHGTRNIANQKTPPISPHPTIFLALQPQHSYTLHQKHLPEKNLPNLFQNPSAHLHAPPETCCHKETSHHSSTLLSSHHASFDYSRLLLTAYTNVLYAALMFLLPPPTMGKFTYS